MKILVTGSTGFLGRALTNLLLDLGHEIRLLVRNKKSAELWSQRGVEIVEGDITDPISVEKAVQGIHSVFHLAGLIGYTKAMHQQMVLVNVVGTSNVLEASIKAGVQKFLHMSSVVAIGASFDGKTLFNEDSEFNLTNLNLGYFETKRRAEEIVRQAAFNKKIHAVCVNPSTVYGAGDATKGSRSVQKKVAQGRFPFYSGGGVNVVHVQDVIHATYRAWEIGRSGERYILAGENLTIKQLFFTIAKAAGVNPPRLYLPNFIIRGIGKIDELLTGTSLKGPISSESAWASTLYNWYDNSKAKDELSLNPRPAEQAIQESVQWMKQNGII